MSDTAVSVGWFDVDALFPDRRMLIAGMRNMLRKQLAQNRAWPFAVSSVRANGQGIGLAYAIVAGHVPIHVDETGPDESDGRIFQFILEVENRPALITTPAAGPTVGVIMGFAPPTDVNTFRTGGMEMKAGMAIHFDITKVYHGVTSLPVPMESLRTDQSPRAVIVQVSGFAADQIGAAVEHAAKWIHADVGGASL